MNTIKTFLVIYTMLLASIVSVSGQQVDEENPVYRIITRQGNEFIGTLVRETSEMVVLQTSAFGEVSIRREDIRRQIIMTPDKIKDGEYWPDNPQSTRYLWSPNGYGLQEGEAYYQNIWVLYNQASLGVTNTFSISAGLVPTILLGADAMPLWIVPKFSIPLQKDKINMSAGAFVGAVVGDTGGGFGIAFGTLTLGSRDSNVNLGMGWGYGGGEWAELPIINVGIMHRLSSRAYFISENFYFPTGDEGLGIISMGGRRIIGTVGLDYALAIPIGAGIERLIAIPFLGFTVPIDGKHAR